MKYAKSEALQKKALAVTPLGAQTFSKSFRYYPAGNAPCFIERGQGAYLWDVDGNKFIDFVCALGPITVGYNDERINKAVIAQLNKGIIFSLQAEVEVQLAEKLCEIVPCAEKVRFVKNGGDATTAAVRLARAFTGRETVLMSGYHGMHDWSIGAGPNHKGIPAAVRELTKNFEYNNISSLKKLFSEYAGKVACVIMEPLQSDGAAPGYLDEVKKVTHENGALLIFDEVVSGFRYALGGASELYNVAPDLAAFGKGMANGMPISAVAGRAEILDLIEQGVFISTTFGGDAISMAGALATIQILEEKGAYKKIWALGTRMMDGLKKLIHKNGVEALVSASGLAPHGGVMFEGAGKLDYLDIQSVYSEAMIENGILTTGINNINLSHTEADIDAFLSAADVGFKNIKKAAEQNSLKGILKGGKVDPIFKRNIR